MLAFIATTTVTWHWAFSRQIQISLRLWVYSSAFTLHTHSLPVLSVRSEIEDEVKLYACNVMVGQMEGRFVQFIYSSFFWREDPYVFFLAEGIWLLRWTGCDSSRLGGFFLAKPVKANPDLEFRTLAARRRICLIISELICDFTLCLSRPRIGSLQLIVV